MISLNALITPADNSIMIVAIKWGFHQDLQTEGGEAIIPPCSDMTPSLMLWERLFAWIYDAGVLRTTAASGALKQASKSGWRWWMIIWFWFLCGDRIDNKGRTCSSHFVLFCPMNLMIDPRLLKIRKAGWIVMPRYPVLLFSVIKPLLKSLKREIAEEPNIERLFRLEHICFLSHGGMNMDACVKMLFNSDFIEMLHKIKKIKNATQMK